MATSLRNFSNRVSHGAMATCASLAQRVRKMLGCVANQRRDPTVITTGQ